jgi:hypothetical protein
MGMVIYPEIRGLGPRITQAASPSVLRERGMPSRKAGRTWAGRRDGPHASGTACPIIDNEPFVNTPDPVPRTNPGILAVAVSVGDSSLGTLDVLCTEYCVSFKLFLACQSHIMSVKGGIGFPPPLFRMAT